MPTALTGQLGFPAAQPGLVQLGGPPLISTWGRSLPSKALPLLAHVYDNDGVSPKGTLSVLNRPAIKATTTNGGLDTLTLEVASATTAAVYGQTTYGQATYGGRLLQGNVVRLTEVGGPFNGFVYSGMAEAFPDTVSPAGTKHEITLAPFGAELGRVYSQALYTQPTDVAQAVRDAVRLTQHCSYDQASVPVSTGTLLATTSGGQVDFRNQTVQQILDTCRSIAGPTWYWYCDELGRVWFQPMGSGAVYTISQAQYTERISNGGSIVDRKNQVPAVGGVPTGGSVNVTATYNGSSQSVIGIRSLNPPLSIPNITDQAALTSIANNVGAVLDRVWNRIQVKTTPAYTRRIHGSQPGGAMVRTWEPVRTPMAESGHASGYAGPHVAQEVIYDGQYQQVTAGDIPVTSQTDVDHMVKALISRAAANSLQVTAAALNQVQTFTGTLQSGTGTVPSPSGQILAALWALNQQMFAAYDPNGVRRAEMGSLNANGISPAQWGFRANDPQGNPIFDSLGLIGAAKALAVGRATSSTQPPTITTYTPLTWDSSAPTFTISNRTQTVLMTGLLLGWPQMGTGSNQWFARLDLNGGTFFGATPNAFGVWIAQIGAAGTYGPMTSCSFTYIATYPPGTYTPTISMSGPGAGSNFGVNGAYMTVMQMGG